MNILGRLLLIFALFQIILSQNNQTFQDNRDIYITVFTHGTIHPHVKLDELSLVFKDEIKDTHYSYVNEWHRQAPIYFKTQAMQGLGLEPINLHPIGKPRSNGATALANIFEYFYQKDHPDRINHYYTFGWSGLLSQKERLKAAEQYHKELKELLKKYHTQGLNPKLRLVGFSHGGTITLNLGLYEPDDINKLEVPVTELILVGTPVQKETECLVDHPMFKRAFQFYSRGDFPQTSDYISTDYFFCHWRFLPHNFCMFRDKQDPTVEHSFELPDKLTQIELQFLIGNHIIAPKHTELWTFAWAQRWYRKQFPLSPIPVIAIVPALLKAIERNLPKDVHELVATVHINEGSPKDTLEIKELYPNLQTKTAPYMVPFLKHVDLQTVCKIAQKYEPKFQTSKKVRKSSVRAERYALAKMKEAKIQACLVKYANDIQRVPRLTKKAKQAQQDLISNQLPNT